MRALLWFVALMAPVMTPSRAAADVTERAPGSFTVKTVVTIAASPDRVFGALVRDIGVWWDPAHTFSGDAKNLSLVAEVGRCFCERLPNGGSVQHAEVIHAAPGGLLRLTGALGPLQEAAVIGTWTWQFARTEQGTTATVTYSVAGVFPGGLDKVADAVDTVIGDQLRRLKAHVEGNKR
jgi:uncharacterized protein YndB with AHSA1/START domain